MAPQTGSRKRRTAKDKKKSSCHVREFPQKRILTGPNGLITPYSTRPGEIDIFLNNFMRLERTPSRLLTEFQNGACWPNNVFGSVLRLAQGALRGL